MNRGCWDPNTSSYLANMVWSVAWYVGRKMTNQMMGSLTLEFHLEAGHFLEGMNWLSSTGERKSGPDRSEGCHGNLNERVL